MFTEQIRADSGRLNLASNDSADVIGRGDVRIQVNDGKRKRNVKLQDTLLAPDVRMNLVSVSKITDREHEVTFGKKGAVIRDQRDEVKMLADRIGDLYFIREDDATAGTACEEHIQDLTLWHQRLGHLNKRCLLEMVNTGAVEGIELSSRNVDSPCEICIKGKQTRIPFRETHRRTTRKLEIIHTDLCGPMRTVSKGGAKYCMTFIDDCTRWTEVFFLRQKSDALKVFQEYKARVEKLTNEKITYLQSDNGREFCNEEFENYLKIHGIQRRLTAPYTPEQNGVAEHMNRTLVEMARCLLFQAGLETSFWAEAVHTAAYLRNRCISSSLSGKTPYEKWKGIVPRLGYLRTVDTEVFVLNKAPGKGKFDARGDKGILIGYSDHTKGYRVWIHKRKTIVVSRDVKFLNETGDIKGPNKVDKLITDVIPTEEGQEREVKEFTISTTPESGIPEVEELHKVPGRSHRGKTGSTNQSSRQYNLRSTSRRRDCHKNDNPNEEKQPMEESQDDQADEDEIFHEANIIQSFSNMIEVSLDEALNGLHTNEWKNALAHEVRQILDRDTWKIVDRPLEKTIVGSRFVLTNKLDTGGKVNRRKARLVAKSFNQRPGIDFEQSYAPVARLESLRLLVAISVYLKMTIRQVDVVTAYLNSHLDKPVYMEVPNELTSILRLIVRGDGERSSIRNKATHMLNNLQGENKVCLLKRALYGLCQAGRQWNIHLDRIIKKLDLTPTAADPCLYRVGQ